MNFNEYQIESRKTAIYQDRVSDKLSYVALGLAGETGEVVDCVKKIFRDDNGEVIEGRKAQLKKELGDVLWYTAQLAIELDLSLDDIAANNIEKLQSRQQRGTLHGSGNDR